MSVRVDWVARPLEGGGVSNLINHCFVLISWNGNFSLPPIQTLSEINRSFGTQSNRNFVTLGAFPSKPVQPGNDPLAHDYGNIIFTENQRADVFNARTLLNGGGSRSTHKNRHEVEPPNNDSDETFARTLTRMALHYDRYSAQHPLRYRPIPSATTLSYNSNGWINSLFRAAGVSSVNRFWLRQFAGIDVGENAEIPLEYFR